MARKIGHVARSIAAGKRPFLTCTIAPETFEAIDTLAARLHLSRGRLIDLAIETLAAAMVSNRVDTKDPEAA